MLAQPHILKYGTDGDERRNARHDQIGLRGARYHQSDHLDRLTHPASPSNHSYELSIMTTYPISSYQDLGKHEGHC